MPSLYYTAIIIVGWSLIGLLIAIVDMKDSDKIFFCNWNLLDWIVMVFCGPFVWLITYLDYKHQKKEMVK